MDRFTRSGCRVCLFGNDYVDVSASAPSCRACWRRAQCSGSSNLGRLVSHATEEIRVDALNNNLASAEDYE